MLEAGIHFEKQIDALLKYKEYVNSFILIEKHSVAVQVCTLSIENYIAQSDTLIACYLFKQKYMEFDVLSRNLKLLTKAKDSFALIEYTNLIFTFLKIEVFEPLYTEYHSTFETRFDRLKTRVEISIFRECNDFYKK